MFDLLLVIKTSVPTTLRRALLTGESQGSKASCGYEPTDWRDDDTDSASFGICEYVKGGQHPGGLIEYAGPYSDAWKEAKQNVVERKTIRRQNTPEKRSHIIMDAGAKLHITSTLD